MARSAGRTPVVVGHDVAEVDAADAAALAPCLVGLLALEQRHLVFDEPAELLVLGRRRQQVERRLLVLVDDGRVGAGLEQRAD